MSRNILILGATSDIAHALAAEFAACGDKLFLASRDADELARIATDLTVRYNLNIQHGIFDADDLASHQNFWQQTLATMGTIDGVVVAFGYLGNPQTARQMPEIKTIIMRNFIGAASILSYCADYFAAQNSTSQKFIMGFSSIAADRGRQKNYVYGAAKAGLSTYLQGLRNRLAVNNIRVITVKPGFVDTAMTFGLPGMFLVAKPTSVAKSIMKHVTDGSEIVYTPWFWRYIMLIIKLIPEKIFKKLNL